jgi:alkyldihydroxyacetonephosphate synthase
MKKNVYGNIEDIVVNLKLVTPVGCLERSSPAPRVSTGPDILHMAMGSEGKQKIYRQQFQYYIIGIFGVITEAVVKIRPLPETRKYGSIVFPDFETGFACLREISRQKCVPASIRLMDNMQFQLGQVLKPEGHSFLEEWVDVAKKWYVTGYKGYDVNKMVAGSFFFIFVWTFEYFSRSYFGIRRKFR